MKKNKTEVFRGTKNVISRYFNCAKKQEISTIVRITSDCPLIDHTIIDKMIQKYEIGNMIFMVITQQLMVTI